MLPNDEYGNKASKNSGDSIKEIRNQRVVGEYTPFETLVSIILSQRTYWKNVKTAIDRFSKRFNGVEDVAKAGVKEIESVIKPAGLYRVRARRIKNIAEDLVEKYDGKIDKTLNLPLLPHDCIVWHYL